MPDTSSHSSAPGYAAKPRLAFAKLVATPTQTSWAQAYNAGNLFVCLSLTKIEPQAESSDEADSTTSLHAVGKEIFNILESEFFTLTEKNARTIKKAITESVKHAPETVSANLCLAVFKEDVLYVFIYGAGKVILKREGKVGILLDKTGEGEEVFSVSGYLKDKDTVILETRQFTKDISEDTLRSAFELILPSDIAEALSPQIHKSDDGDQAAIIIAYHGFSSPAENEESLPEETSEEQDQDDAVESDDLLAVNKSPEPEFVPARRSKRGSFMPKFHLPHIALPHLTHRRKISLSVAIILAVLLTTSVFMTQGKQKNEKTQQLFVSIYEPAKKSYDEGKSIQSLNDELARKDFLKAEKILKDGLSKFETESSEKKRLEELLTSVQSELEGSGSENMTKIKEVTSEESSLLGISKTTKNALAIGQSDAAVYFITPGTIESVDKSTDKKTTVIKNEKDWEAPVAIIPYQGNLYVLDQKKGVLKYTASGDGFSKGAYFKEAPDLSKAVSMSVDGSVWILFQDGTIFKYTKGVSDGLKVSGLDKPLQKPTSIFTDLDTENVYVLDAGNSRIIKLSKTGAFQSQYQNSMLQKARTFEVMEKDKKADFLAGEKTYEIEL